MNDYVEPYDYMREVTATYGDGTGQWHSQYLSGVKRQPTVSLQFTITDCKAACKRNPDNPKCPQYLDEILYCQEEIRRRRDIETANQLHSLLNGLIK